MSDTTHVQEKEALESATNRVLQVGYRGIALGTVAFTTASKWTAHDDGSIAGTAYAPPTLTVDAKLKAIIDAYLAAQPPVTPPPVDPPVDPPPASGDASNIGAIQPGDTWQPPEDA